jgi:hypothetical protein
MPYLPDRALALSYSLQGDIRVHDSDGGCAVWNQRERLL